MKKQYFFLLASALVMLVGVTTDLNAQVTGMPDGYINTGFPAISTAENPVWYNMMTSNYPASSVEVRRNRYMYWDGIVLGGEKLDAGISEAVQNDKYLWRLEQGSTPSDDTHKYVYLVNKLTGERIADASGVTMSTQGVELKTGTSQEIKDLGLYTAEIPVAGQFYLQYEAAATLSYLNISSTYTIVWFSAHPSVTKSSGWFFYPATSTPTEVETAEEALFNVYPNPFNTELQIDNGLKDLEKVEIFNIQGVKVISEHATPYRVSTAALVPGLYIVKAYADGNVYTRKMSKSGSI